MAINFSKNWASEIASVSESVDYQTCEIRINWSSETIEAFDYKTGESYLVPKEVNELGLQMIKVGDSDPTFPDLVAEMHDLLGAEDAAEVFVQQTEPTGVEGDIWVKKVDRSAVAFILEGDTWVAAPVDTVVYSGQARFIPVRAGVWQGGEAQVNATTIRAARFQLKRSAMPDRIHAGAIVNIVKAPFNKNLEGRSAKVNDDFQGSTTATRTIHVMIDADSEDSWDST